MFSIIDYSEPIGHKYSYYPEFVECFVFVVLLYLSYFRLNMMVYRNLIDMTFPGMQKERY
jgi:hypothetical protein